ncbi:MAG: ATP-binding protein [Hydrogenoanaerobacterium sp.]
MKEYVFGANILENLTTGMYQDSKVIYREYIQNACDQVDKAVRCGLLQHDEGKIDIWLDTAKRTISVEDNATGICAAEFEKTLANIADSDKKIGEDKGFRGIGRLCGLAYCRELIFTSTAAGEGIISVMKCDAEKMRDMISQNERGEKYTASEVLHQIYDFSAYPTDEIQAHWFKVEMVGINDENTDLLDFSQIKDYLSFVAPVPYQNTFIFRTEVYEHAKQLNYSIDEYQILLNGEPVFKKYKTNFKTSKGDDEIFSVTFKEFFDENDKLLAWMWVGVTRFKAVISKDCKMRGLRLRKENIQIGSDDALQKLFKEDRGHHYFIGEVFAVSKNLIPNSQRDYFNENESRAIFERKLHRYFDDDLHKIYYEGSAINSAFKKIDDYERKEAELQVKKQSSHFVNEDHLETAIADVAKAKKEAEKAKSEIEKKKQKADADANTVMTLVIKRIENEREQRPATMIPKTPRKSVAKETNPPRRADKLSAYNKSERKLISKIFGIIVTALDEKTAETIIEKIEDGLQ